MKPLHRSLWVSVLLLLLQACGRDQISLESRNFEDVVDQRQNLTFVFNRALAPDSLLNLWDSTEYVAFSPKVKGQFRWLSPTELTFSPDGGFAPSTDYEAKLTEALRNLSAEKAKVDNAAIRFHTPYLDLQNVGMYWTKEANGKIAVRMQLKFNYEMNPTDVANQLKVQVDGKPQSFEVRSSVPSETVGISVVPGTNGKDPVPTQLAMGAGLQCAACTQPLRNPIQFKTEIPPRDQFSIVRVDTEYDGETSYLRVQTNQAIESENLRALIQFDPAVDIDVQPGQSGFTIRGDFKPEQSYELTIAEGLTGIFGGTLGRPFSQSVVFGEPEPAISFASAKNLYLSSQTHQQIGVRIQGVPNVQVQVYKIFENNLSEFFRNYGYSLRSRGGNEAYYDDYYSPYNNYEHLGNRLVDTEIAVSSLPKEGGLSLLDLRLGGTLRNDLSAHKGIYIIKINDPDNRWLGDQQVVAISDVGLIARQTDNEVWVFANSIMGADPLTGVEMELISRNNQVMAKATTNAQGIARFTNLQHQAAGFAPQMVTARHQSDFTYLHFDQTGVETSRYAVEGLRSNPSHYLAYVYGDRNLYRPGETVRLNTLVRTEDWQQIGKVPVKLKVLLPNGREFLTQRGTLDDQGAFATQFELPAAAVTGTYEVEAYTSNDVLLTTYPISVEEFMPDRIKVNLQLAKETAGPGETVTADLTATNLFGPPAAGRKYEVEFSIRRVPFRPKGWDNYSFELEGGNQLQFENDLRQGETSQEGKAEESFTVPTSYEYAGMLSGRVFATVFDETGRPVNRAMQARIPTQDIFYGIGDFDWYNDVRRPVRMPLVAVNPDGKALDADAVVQVIKYEWQTVVEKRGGSRYSYVSQKKERVLEEKRFRVTGNNAAYTFTPVESGEYEIRVLHPSQPKNQRRYVAREFYAYGMGYTANSSFEVDRDGQIIIEASQETYRSGDQAELIFKTPFAGKLLVTVERGEVYEHHYLTTDKRSARLTLPITDRFLPNIYITATLFRPLDPAGAQTQVPLTVAHGFLPLKVEKPTSRIPLEIKIPEKSRSKTTQEILVKANAGSGVKMTVAVVDEGILQVKGYQTPDPHGYFYQKRALEVKGFDAYARLFPDLMPSTSSFGGDGYDLDRRVNPLPNRRTKLVSFWSGVLTTDGKGEAKFNIEIPQFSGDLRVMAVAYHDDAFGAADAHMKVADPLVLSTALPRFLSPNDEIEVPVTLTNTTNQTASVKATLAATGASSVTGETSQSVSIPANSERQARFRLKAAQALGTTTVKLSANGMGEAFTEEIELPVRPAVTLTKQSEAGQIQAGGTQNVNFPGQWMEGTAQQRLLVSRSPIVEFTDNLNELLQYPYGCAEQTISVAFAQLYFRDLSKTLQNPRMIRDNPDYHVQTAIRKLYTLQTYNGALVYWPGSSENWWVTAYGAHFLREAQKAGFDVSDRVLERIYGYLSAKVKEKEQVTYRYYDAGGVIRDKTIVPKEAAYSLYVLALAGQPDIATMNHYKAQTAQLAIDSRYLLAAAYQLAGDVGSYRTILPKDFSGERSVSVTGGSFYSYLRDQAVALNALLEVDPNHPQVAPLARQLSTQLKEARYVNTQENAFSLLALGKLARENQKGNPTAEIRAGSQKLAELKGNEVLVTKGLEGKNVSIQTGGSGSVYYFAEQEGIPASGTVTEEDEVLKVRRTYYDRKGNPITNNTVQQNDLIVVKLSLNTLDGSRVDNVVIADLLPAGFEIENPRLSEEASLPWIKGAATPDYFDIRDDRLNLFTAATGSVQNYYYMVRAVSPGTFRVGPVSADAMYKGEYHSYHGAGTVQVTE
ncbi:hypothetical protein SAMN05421823_10868 [Catalinimonas alkaloidigena]|uniref:Alpha-2-macroglobulin family protein n=1 Tax=Catalinimonas alkaloidigena TaxID=1075417 RepID=A0A1G9MS64_9BACT|nr:MG2 domain-containing protein [Catalinimonas alkaloidigena]SDL76944.1 hypothetical protein SAMN05421823_10868 [Catalinimonas alkaloidigena]